MTIEYRTINGERAQPPEPGEPPKPKERHPPGLL